MRLWRSRRITIALALLFLITIIYLYIKPEKPATHTLFEPLELLWWPKVMSWNYDETRTCGFAKCRFTNKRENLQQASGVLFYGSNMNPHDFPLPRMSLHLWALLHEESPRNVPYVPHEEFLQHFNLTSTFSRHSDFPLTIQYLPHAEDLGNFEYYLSFARKQRASFDHTLAPVLFLQSDCDTMTGREDYVLELMKHIRVDSYGACLHNRDLPESLQHDYLNNLYSAPLLRFISSYKFMIAIENGACDDYITEKYWRPLMVGTIPIYFGSPSIRDWEPNNSSAIYISDFANAAALAEHLKQVGDNATAYNTYRQKGKNQKLVVSNKRLQNALFSRRYSIGEHKSIFQQFECFVCQNFAKHNLHSPPKSADKTHYSCPYPPAHAPLQNAKQRPKNADDWRSMMAMGRCQAQLLDQLFRANRNYTQQDYDARLTNMISQGLCD
ncbi:alpha-(1,3)-fucosyltransferase B [Scaptodrosophila lebanonensis]|uniref:Fucosyltransferase n=1 Tax=Drosophila lebanonensis TaxID=7225 RepID=A0A6J2TLU7_DROLE|nr:alpha-(1,3)-fucosyltransferase B [Scaptodrosophila lebanonensis]